MDWRIVVCAVTLAAVGAVAQESSEAPAEEETTESQPEPAAGTETESDEVFIPTKEIPADSEVVFPVDI